MKKSFLATTALYLVVFFSGGVLMGFEMTGSNMLAPYFGSSVYTWGSVIGLFLTALSLGYLFGGKLADRRPEFKLLCALVVLSGATVSIVPLVTPIIGNWLLMSKSVGVRGGPLIASLILFTIPSILMGMVSPFAIRLQAKNIEQLGNIAGKLFALSTFGSIAGTMLTTFVLIPAIGSRSITHALGTTLVVVSAAALLLHGPTGKRTRHVEALVLIALIAILQLLVLTPRGHVTYLQREKDSIVYEVESPYHLIAVVQSQDLNEKRQFEPTYKLCFNSNIESEIFRNPPYRSAADYTTMLHLGLIFKENPKRILVIGGGGGVTPMLLRKTSPESTIDVVEIDEKVYEISKRFFGLRTSEDGDPQLRYHIDDGRLFLHRSKDTYDMIILDAFSGGGRIPSHLMTFEFLSLVKSHLSPDGVVVMNIISAVEGKDAKLFHAEYKTYRHKGLFKNLYAFTRNASPSALPEVQNVIIVAPAARAKPFFNTTALTLKAVEVDYKMPQKLPRFKEYAACIVVHPDSVITPGSDIPVLTDDYRPVDAIRSYTY